LQGEACATSSSLDRVIAYALGLELDGDTAVMLPPIGHTDPPARRDRDHVLVDGLLMPSKGAVLLLGTVVETARFTTRAVHGVDPGLGLVEVRGEIASDALADVDWGLAVQYGQLALAHELVGLSRRVLQLAREHALERIQFGQPIARFQAVRHRLAEALVAIETAVAVLDAAWLDRSPVTASMAKATAGRSARTVSKHGQQVLAGIGFTTEHDLHRYVRRILVLDQLFGSSTILTKQFGEELLATRELPRLLPL
jgi:acyl-CoA dehydrogenase-like protein